MKLILTTLYLLVGLLSRAQVVKERTSASSSAKLPVVIDGLGKLKIGRTDLTIMLEFATELGVQIEAAPSRNNLTGSNHRPRIFELLPATGPCKQARVFLVTECVVVGHRLEELELTFFEGELSQLSCKGNEELLEALVKRYGPGTQTQQVKKGQCFHPELSGDALPFQEVTTTLRWGSPALPSSLVSHTYVGGEACGMTATTRFLVFSKALMERKRTCEGRAR